MSKRFMWVLILGFLALCLWASVLRAKASGLPTGTAISNVKVTNLRDISLTVSWVTDGVVTGTIEYGTTAALGSVAYDDRGANTVDDTHYVTLWGLTPMTTYYFDILSGDQRDDNGGAHYTVTTGPTIGLPERDIVYGQVFTCDGTTPAEGAMVYITLADNDDIGSPNQAAPLSSLVDADGYWYTNLGDARLEDLSAYFSYSPSGDQLILEAQGAAEGTDDLRVDTAIDSPAPAMMICPTEMRTCYVRLNDDPTNYDTVQAAVDASTHVTDVVKVAGVCSGVSTRMGVTQVVYIGKTLTLRGGYTTTNWTISDPVANPTTLDAEGQGRVLYITGDISPTIEGLRITGGDADGLGGGWWAGADAGGGLYVTTATATIRDNQVFSNTAEYGGGLYLSSSAAVLSGNTVTSNSAVNGGGLYLFSSGASLNRNTVTANTAIAGGGLSLTWSDAPLSGNTVMTNTAAYCGGLDLWHSAATLSGNTMAANSADWWGGGLCLDDSSTTLTGNTIADNTAYMGGGLHLFESDAILVNNLVADNQADGSGSGLYIWGSSAHLLHTTIAHNGSTDLAEVTAAGLPTGTGGDGSGVYVSEYADPWPTSYSAVVLINTILVSHTVGITVTAGNTVTLEGTLWCGNGQDIGGAGTILTGTVNVYGDPAFVAPDAGDYHLRYESAAIDAGVDVGVTTDMDGDPRPFGYGVDIGADEYMGLFAPRVGTFEPSGGSGRVGEWAEFTTTYRDPNGYEDIQWAFFFLDRALPIASGGLAAAYYRPANILWLMDGGFCRPGQAKTLSTDYATLDCGNTWASEEGDMLTINWRVRPEQCFDGSCGVNRAYEYVRDSAGLGDVGVVGWWVLYPASGPTQDAGPTAQPTVGDLERLREEIEAWRSALRDAQ